jgi:hypothetical protein
VSGGVSLQIVGKRCQTGFDSHLIEASEHEPFEVLVVLDISENGFDLPAFATVPDAFLAFEQFSCFLPVTDHILVALDNAVAA